VPGRFRAPVAVVTTGPPIGSLTLLLTARCNLGCSYCYQNDRRGGRMPWRTAREALALALSSRLADLELVFSGGEPLLEAATIRRAVAWVGRVRAPERRVRFSLFTNGLLLDDGMADFLARHDFTVQLSFDGSPAAQDVRGAGTWQRLDALLDRLRRRQARLFRDRLRIAVTVTPATVPLLADSVAYLLGKGVLSIVAAPAISGCAGWRDAEGLAELEAQFARAAGHCLRHHRATGESPFFGFGYDGAPRGDHDRSRAMCDAVTGRALTVDTDGSVYACGAAAGGVQRTDSRFLAARLAALRVGRLEDVDLALRLEAEPERLGRLDVLRGKENKRSSWGRCRDCPHFAVCLVCPLAIAHLDGNEDPDRVPDFICAYNRTALAALARLGAAPDPAVTLLHPAPLYRAIRRARARL